MPRKKRTNVVSHKRAAAREGGRQKAVLPYQPDFVPYAATQPTAFSLQQEAINTSGHRDWGDKRLRNSHVNFVSAGTDRPSAINPDAMAKMSLEERFPEAQDSGDDAEDTEMTGTGEDQDMVDTPEEETEAGFFMDTAGSGHIETGFPPPRVRSVSPTPSDSSEEVILFKGRYNMGKEPQKNGSADALDRKIRIVEDKIHQKEELLDSIHTQEAQPQRPSRTENNRKARSRDSDERDRRMAAKEKEDALLADYIANMEPQESDEAHHTPAFNNRELGGSDVEIEVWVDESNESSSRETESKKISKGKSIQQDTPSAYSWDREDIEDLDDIPTDDELFNTVQDVLSKRDRPTGIQYLVVWDNHTMDECRWVPASTLVSISGASDLIKAFENKEKLVAEFLNDGVSDDDSEDDDDDDDEDEDDDDMETIEETMTDEQVARLLQKQEELGMGSDRLMLFDDAAGGEDDETSYIIGELSRPNKRGMKRPRGDLFLPASALADAYDGFDVMDRDRPSLQKRQKGRKGKRAALLGLSDDLDPDLATELQIQYENDREKKKFAKQEREEQRAQGLLGKGRPGKPDMKAKYKEGMSMFQIKDEIKNFLLSDSPQFGLPPMEKAHRKLVHEICSAFNIKTTSYGSGKSRFPMLIRTGRTRNYSEELFVRLEQTLGRRYLPRMDAGKQRGGPPKASGSGRGGGFNNAAVSYRDGEVVGGSAPELGVENKGRAMLEKMGWSHGDGLGALNNKGILQPVSHVVKTTKAGLG